MFVKICGVTTEEDALLSVAMGADAIGFNFVSSSARQVHPRRVRDIVRRLPPEVLAVGVFRNESRQRVVDTVHTARLRGAQLHGWETAEDCRWIREHVPMTIKAFGADDPNLDRIDDYGADAVLVDNPRPGSGETFDWSVLGDRLADRRLILAGGLTPMNVGSAIATVRPWGVDVATGVEESPGHKDAAKVRAFIQNARHAAESLPPRPESDADADAAPSRSDDALAPYDWRTDADL